AGPAPPPGIRPSGVSRRPPAPAGPGCRNRPWPGCAWRESARAAGPRPLPFLAGGRAKIFPMARTALHITGDDTADALLSRDPLALLIGMVLDQQVPIEKAFSSPAELERRLGGGLDARSIAAMDPEALVAVF